MDYFEQLIGDYYEGLGYFLQKNLRYGYNNMNEADLLGFNPKTGEKIHVEITERRVNKNKFISSLKKKFNDKYTRKLYKDHFGTSVKIKKIYIVWWFRSEKSYIKKQELEKEFGVEIVSYEDIFSFFKKELDKNLGDTRKIRHLIDLCFTYEHNIKEEN